MVKALKVQCVKYKNDKESAELKLQQTENRLEQFKIKEANETKIMEDMVAQVEENLLATKKRAQNAENQVEQLKNDISLLRSTGSNNPEIQELRYRLQDAKEKGKMVTHLLYQASNDADMNIKNLMRGIETLQNISGILTSIDKISTMPN
ncbi:hypothetical protein DICPUDRAFT_32720 [Dictyostelium purpureum]|uniref:Endosome-associated-trafficking regulator 1 n=1 Tax=Dictyostelium purpureum TaxID=5786 RepID=F0ZJL3_DICPU|nr:uncharacterized protein DICPUDRAFT_32720 [Dictyostelium purpureum]EGC35881.1 hypothetical protein DICPUDRAFT_32720 [Dictyostelium purpureum]|eukprot:XP_003287612.1 hypothetical protein DICPUDRAFT_32720 [Dictyostelium purpureum]